MFYDITRTLTPRTAVFPGDTPVSIAPVMQMRNGNSCNVTALTMSAHAGTHVDAPLHYSDDGIGIDAVRLDVLMGPARVVTVETTGEITEEMLRAALPTPHSTFPARLLLHTPASAVPNDVWQPAFAHFSAQAAHWLGANGVRLIGVDTPSVDYVSSKELPAHKTFLRHNVIIMENLCLTDVPDGDYDLIALPLRIAGNDAAPARVVLSAT
jgi:arylformamidase